MGPRQSSLPKVMEGRVSGGRSGDGQQTGMSAEQAQLIDAPTRSAPHLSCMMSCSAFQSTTCLSVPALPRSLQGVPRLQPALLAERAPFLVLHLGLYWPSRTQVPARAELTCNCSSLLPSQPSSPPAPSVVPPEAPLLHSHSLRASGLLFHSDGLQLCPAPS